MQKFLTPQARNYVFPGPKGSGPKPFQEHETLEFVNLKEASSMLKASRRARPQMLDTDSDDSRMFGSMLGEDATDTLSGQCTDTDSQLEEASLVDEDSADEATHDQMQDDVAERHDDNQHAGESDTTSVRLGTTRVKQAMRKSKKVEFVALVKDDVDGNNW